MSGAISGASNNIGLSASAPKTPVKDTAYSLEAVEKSGVVLKKGMVGASVSEIHTKLKDLGYNVEVNSTFDAQTSTAVKKFQSDHGIKQTGNIGKLTLDRINDFQPKPQPTSDKAELSGSSTASKPDVKTNVSFLDEQTKPADTAPTLDLVAKGKGALKKGMTGESVRILQEKLTAAGFKVDPTGTFDDNTEKALKAFQKESGIKQTGQLGRFTLDALEEETQDESYSEAIADADKVEIPTTRPQPRPPELGQATGTDAVDIGSEGTEKGIELAKKAKQVALAMQPHRNPKKGKCYRGVKNAVKQATGVELVGGEAYQAANQLAKSSKFKEVKVSSSQLDSLPPGAIVVWGKTGKSPHGHISIALGNGKEASDHVSNQLESLRGASNFRVFLPK